jgi:hypothetical protein
MTFRTKAALFVAIAAWFAACAIAAPDAQWVEIGGGLLVQRDGSVIAVWNLPDAAAMADPLMAPDAIGRIAPWSPTAWRLARDW